MSLDKVLCRKKTLVGLYESNVVLKQEIRCGPRAVISNEWGRGPMEWGATTVLGGFGGGVIAMLFPACCLLNLSCLTLPRI